MSKSSQDVSRMDGATESSDLNLLTQFEVLIQNIVKENRLKQSLIRQKELRNAELSKDIESKDGKIKFVKEQLTQKKNINQQLSQSLSLRERNIDRLRDHMKMLEEHEYSLVQKLAIKQQEKIYRRKQLETLRDEAAKCRNDYLDQYVKSPLGVQMRKLGDTTKLDDILKTIKHSHGPIKEDRDGESLMSSVAEADDSKDISQENVLSSTMNNEACKGDLDDQRESQDARNKGFVAESSTLENLNVGQNSSQLRGIVASPGNTGTGSIEGNSTLKNEPMDLSYNAAVNDSTCSSIREVYNSRMITTTTGDPRKLDPPDTALPVHTTVLDFSASSREEETSRIPDRPTSSSIQNNMTSAVQEIPLGLKVKSVQTPKPSNQHLSDMANISLPLKTPNIHTAKPTMTSTPFPGRDNGSKEQAKDKALFHVEELSTDEQLTSHYFGAIESPADQSAHKTDKSGGSEFEFDFGEENDKSLQERNGENFLDFLYDGDDAPTGDGNSQPDSDFQLLF